MTAASRLDRRGLLAFAGAALMAFSVVPTAALAGAYDDFFHAIALDDDRTLARLLAAGVDPDSVDAHGQVALYAALRDRSPKCARLLAAAPGLHVDAPNEAGETPLMMAALRGDEAVARTLLSRGAAVRRTGWSPLHYAATGGSVPLVRLLLAQGAPLDARSPDGRTPLMMAARYGGSEVAEALLRAGADRSLVDDAGRDAAAEAEAGDADGVARWLRAWTPPR